MSDVKVTVIETATGKTLAGQDAPLASQVQAWLEMNPGWEAVPREEDDDPEGSEEEDTDGEEDGKPKPAQPSTPPQSVQTPTVECPVPETTLKPVVAVIQKAKAEDDEYRISNQIGEHSYYG